MLKEVVTEPSITDFIHLKQLRQEGLVNAQAGEKISVKGGSFISIQSDEKYWTYHLPWFVENINPCIYSPTILSISNKKEPENHHFNGVFPNPLRGDFVTIQLPSDLLEDNFAVKVIDLQGKVRTYLENKTLQSYDDSLELEVNLESGVYILQVSDDKGMVSYTEKIIKL